MVFSRLVYYVLLLILHLSQTCRRFFDCLSSASLYSLFSSRLSSDKVKQYAQHWKKVPNHVCIAIADVPVIFEPVAQLVVWCTAAGVKDITIWDNQGLCKASAHLLQEYIAKTHANYFKAASAQYPIRFSNNIDDDRNSLKTVPQQTTPGKNIPALSSSGVTIHICNDADGRSAIVKAVTLANQQRTAIDRTWLNSTLTSSIPEIDLALVFSKSRLLFGLLPWHLRVAEIM
eukprot:gene6323-7484_t